MITLHLSEAASQDYMDYREAIYIAKLSATGEVVPKERVTEQEEVVRRLELEITKRDKMLTILRGKSYMLLDDPEPSKEEAFLGEVFLTDSDRQAAKLADAISVEVDQYFAAMPRDTRKVHTFEEYTPPVRNGRGPSYKFTSTDDEILIGAADSSASGPRSDSAFAVAIGKLGTKTHSPTKKAIKKAMTRLKLVVVDGTIRRK